MELYFKSIEIPKDLKSKIMNSIQTKKQKLLNSMNKSQKAFQNLTLIVIDPILAQFNPI